MGCSSCGGQSQRSMPLTSGDFAGGTEEVPPGAATFKVLGDGYQPAVAADPAAGIEAADEVDVTYHATYRSARIHQAQHGGKLRAT